MPKKSAPAETPTAQTPDKEAAKAIAKKRARSAYSFFIAEHRATLPAGTGFAEASRACSEAWKSAGDKSKWEAMATAAKDELAATAPPPAPKREPSAYIKFSVAKRKELQAANPEMTFRGLSVECARLWKELSTEDKASWKTIQ